MNKFIGCGILAAGIILLVFGIQGLHSYNSGISRFFTGSPNHKSLWLFAGGCAGTVVGLILTLRGK